MTVKELAKAVRKGCRSIAKDSVAKEYHVEVAITGRWATDENPFELICKDDSGYRSITAGDIRGNRGYVLLYSENAEWANGKETWNCPCFPTQKAIEKWLRTMEKGLKISGATYYSESEDSTVEWMSNEIKALLNN